MTMKYERFKPEARKLDILAAASRVAEIEGYGNVTRDQIALEARCSGATIQYHFGTMAQLRKQLMRHAVHYRNLRVIAQGIAARDSQALKADAGLRKAALEAIR